LSADKETNTTGHADSSTTGELHWFPFGAEEIIDEGFKEIKQAALLSLVFKSLSRHVFVDKITEQQYSRREFLFQSVQTGRTNYYRELIRAVSRLLLKQGRVLSEG